jgi:hypothetical protein
LFVNVLDHLQKAGVIRFPLTGIDKIVCLHDIETAPRA